METIGTRLPSICDVELEIMLTKKPPTAKLQAITGVSPQTESVIEELYPSIAMTGIGAFLNTLYNSIPVRVWGLKVSHLLFALPTAPIAVLAYFYLKVLGAKYVVTNRAVCRKAGMGERLYQSVPLAQVTDVAIDENSRQEFYSSADIRLSDSAGKTLLVLEGVPFPERFQQVIVEARDAQHQVAASLNRINNRK